MGRAVVFATGLLILLFGVPTFADDGTAPETNIVSLVAILAVFAAVFYFMLIRPQRRRQAKHKELVKGIKRGDSVVTAGGIYGEIDSIGDTSVVLKLEDGGKLRIAKSSVVDKRVK